PGVTMSPSTRQVCPDGRVEVATEEGYATPCIVARSFGPGGPREREPAYIESASGDLFTLMTHQPAVLANDPPLQEVVAICGESDDDVSPGRNLARPGTGDGFEDFFETQRERLCRAIWM